MIDRFHVTGSAEPRPEAARVLFCDGSADDSFRPGIDLELSHWVPNRTPARWKADTTTEICLRFVADPPAEAYDLVVNNHVDVDGMLCLFALVHSDLAREHAATLVGAAECGDLFACVPRPAFRLFQELTLVMRDARAQQLDVLETYRRGFERARGVLTGEAPEAPEVSSGWAALDFGVEAVETSRVMIANLHDRFSLFALPPLEGDELARALVVPPFNALVDDSVWLWPQVRNRFDGEVVQLVAVPTHDGTYMDLWIPGYSWADTPERWPVPGMVEAGSSNAWDFRLPALREAVTGLQADEPRPGTWALAERLTPFSSLKGRGFPVVLSFVDDDGAPAPSGLSAEAVADRLAPAFATRS